MFKSIDSKEYYESIYRKYNKVAYIKTDPIELVYNLDGHREFISFVSSIFSYGKVKSIKKFLVEFFTYYGKDPFNINSYASNCNLYYRFQKNEDIKIFVEFVTYIYKNYGSIEKLFLSFSSVLEEAFIKFCKFAREFGNQEGAHRGYFNLFPSGEGLYSKRLNMFLRWMIRSDNIDFGLWTMYKPSELKYPMDTHITKFAIANNLINSKQNNIKNVNRITEYFRKYSYNDPVKYDFALTRQALLIGCTFKKSHICNNCLDNNMCLFC